MTAFRRQGNEEFRGGLSGVAKQEGTGIMGRKETITGIRTEKCMYVCVCVCGGGGGGVEGTGDCVFRV